MCIIYHSKEKKFDTSFQNPISIDKVLLFDLSPEFIAKMIKRLAGRVPISITVGKARDAKNKIYPPMVPYLKYAGIDPVRQQSSGYLIGM